MRRDASCDLLRLFADLLDYPTPALIRKAKECTELLSTVCPPAAELLAGFRQFVEHEPLILLEEIYTSTFDLQVVCYPYVGHHLFGESYQRSRFMARLNQGYQEKGFTSGKELPDHVAVVLRFLALGREDEFSQVLLDEGLIPAVDKMSQAFGIQKDSPYGQVIRALSLLLLDLNRASSRNPEVEKMKGIDNG